MNTTHDIPGDLLSRLSRGRRALADESGSATAEYAVATMAAVGFAGLLVVILRGDEVRGILTDLVHRALTVAG
jgi:Flp pilus assembly pilin Flp